MRDILGGLDAKAAARVVASGGDVAIIIDHAGVIRDVAVSDADPTGGEVGGWLDKRWADTVTLESRQKVEDMLRDAADNRASRWREINHPTSRGASISLRYMTVNTGDKGHVIAIGRDQRAIADLQQRLIKTQQTMERDYARLREAESRYRLLFHLASEAIIVVDATSRKVADANPAANRLVGAADSALLGRHFVTLFDVDSRDAAGALLALAQSGAQGDSHAKLSSKGQAFSAAASLFRQERSALILVRLALSDTAAEPLPDSAKHLLDVLDRIPDAFVVADDQTRILAENAAFLELTRHASAEQIRGRSLDEFLGRPGLDRNILASSAREHGVVKNFATVLRNRFGETEDVEVSGAYSPEAGVYGFAIRVAPRDAARPRATQELPRSVEHLANLVGRMTLKELVRDTTDLVERMCIEAALELTDNNRASAAELLGLSRQSLYSKLHRYGLNNASSDID